MLSIASSTVGFAPGLSMAGSAMRAPVVQMAAATDVKPVVVGIAADSGCGKSTFMRRLTSIFGGESKLLDIGRETNTLVSDMTTVICLDDYHKWDRTGRKSNPEWPNGITALHEACQDWDKMAADVTDLKAGKTVSKPIYNHITGELDPYEEVPATPIVIFEGLHPLYDSRVNAALDMSVYLDITDDVKFAWKAQRDIAERGATMEEVQAAIDARKPDFAAYVEPQKAKADIVVQVLLSDLIDDPTGKFLKVKTLEPYFTECGVKRVVVSAPVKEPEALNVVLGCNHGLLKEEQKLVTNASCTTNCLAPVVKVVKENFGIKHGCITTVHDVTGTQTVS